MNLSSWWPTKPPATESVIAIGWGFCARPPLSMQSVLIVCRAIWMNNKDDDDENEDDTGRSQKINHTFTYPSPLFPTPDIHSWSEHTPHGFDEPWASFGREPVGESLPSSVVDPNNNNRWHTYPIYLIVFIERFAFGGSVFVNIFTVLINDYLQYFDCEGLSIDCSRNRPLVAACHGAREINWITTARQILQSLQSSQSHHHYLRQPRYCNNFHYREHKLTINEVHAKVLCRTRPILWSIYKSFFGRL